MHVGKKFAQIAVEFRHSAGVTRCIVAVAVLRIEIHQIDKTKPVKAFLLQGKRFLHTVCIAFGGEAFRYALPCKNIADFPHTNRVVTCVLQQIQHRILWRRNRIVVPTCGARKGVAARKGARDNSAHGVLAR